MDHARRHRGLACPYDGEARCPADLRRYGHRDRDRTPSAFPLTAAPNRGLSRLGFETDGLVPALPRSYHALASQCHGGHPATRRACAPRTAIRDRRQHRLEGMRPGRMARPETWRKEVSALEKVASWRGRPGPDYDVLRDRRP